jgi:predicted dehydrogenase
LGNALIHVAVLGCGYWGPNLLRNFAENDTYRVVACADVDATRLERLRPRYPDVCFSTEYDRLLHDPTIDAVAIATPAATHYPLAREALCNGKHVLVEKPLATTVADAEHLIALAARQRCTLMVDHTFVYTGAVRKIHELVVGDELGKIYYLDSVRINLGLFRHDVNVLWDLAPHDLSIMERLVHERPVAVSATGQAHLRPPVLDVAYLAVHFASDMVAHFHCNWLAPVKIRRIIIGGSKRLLVYDDAEQSEKVKVYDRGIDVSTTDEVYNMLVQYRSGDMFAPKLETREALAVVAEHFAECILTGRRPLTDGASGLAIVRVLEAAERSVAEDSRRVRL